MLSTVGVLSLQYGDEVIDGVTMTGTINPTGTVGVVGGIPEKIQGAIDSKKFTNNGILDDNFEVVGVRSEAIMSRALDLGRTQVSRAISVLDANGSMPALTVGSFEKAGVSRERGLVEKFNAIEHYSAGYPLARILAYVGDFPTQGFER